MTEAQYRRSGRMWFVGDGLIFDNLPPSCRTEQGRPRECSCPLMVFNPNGRAAKVTARFYHTDRPPTRVPLAVGPGRIETLELASLGQVPHNQSFWIAVESDVPVLPQALHQDFTLWDPTPDSLPVVRPYPGPLSDERHWTFTDCFGGAVPLGWHEQETLSILNPGPRPASVRVQYVIRSARRIAEETVAIAPRRVAQLNVWERTPRLAGLAGSLPVAIRWEYALRLDASVPILAQSTRRARWQGWPPIIGSRSTMGVPHRGRGFRQWHYPGGIVADYGVLPRAGKGQHPLSQCDNTWNLLFVDNLDSKAARVELAFHGPRGRGNSAVLKVAPRRTALECLHAAPWLGRFSRVGEPFALTVTSDRAVVPEMCDAEFEMWSAVCPGAMAAVHFHPGPLREEKVWWLGIGQAGGADDRPTEWKYTYQFMNTSRRKIRLTLSLHGLGGRRRFFRAVDLPAGAVAAVDAGEFPHLPVGRPFAARAASDSPFCAQVFGRTFTRGLPHPRAMFSNLGVPMTLAAAR